MIFNDDKRNGCPRYVAWIKTNCLSGSDNIDAILIKKIILYCWLNYGMDQYIGLMSHCYKQNIAKQNSLGLFCGSSLKLEERNHFLKFSLSEKYFHCCAVIMRILSVHLAWITMHNNKMACLEEDPTNQNHPHFCAI